MRPGMISRNEDRVGLFLTRFPDKSKDPDGYELFESVTNVIRLAMSECNLLCEVLGEHDAGKGRIVNNFEAAAARALVAVVDFSDQTMPVAWEAGYFAAMQKNVVQIVVESQKDDVQKKTYLRDTMLIGYDPSDLMAFGETLKKHLRAAAPMDGELPLNLVEGAEKLRRSLMEMRVDDDLFSQCKLHEAKQLIDRVSQWSDRELEVWGSQQVREIGTSFHKRLKEGGFATFYYPGSANWEADRDDTTRDEYDASLFRAISENNLYVKRIYILSAHNQVDEEKFRERVLRDLIGGVDAHYVVLSARDIYDHTGIQDFAIWDGKLFARVDYTETAPTITKCTYARERASGKESKIITNAIKNQLYLEETVKESVQPVPFLHTEAYYLRKSYRDNIVDAPKNCLGCSVLHGAWQVLKLLGMVANPLWHRAFYQHSIGDFLANRVDEPPLRILLCGPADFGLLYHTAEILGRKRATDAKFTVIDRCQIPLNSCEWFIRNLEVPVQLEVNRRHKDVIEYGSSTTDSFDLIIADGFLSDSAPDDSVGNDRFRAEVLQVWWDRLRPCGRIVTTARIAPTNFVNDSEVRSEYVKRVEVQHKMANDPSLADLGSVQKMASEYSKFMQSYPIPNIEALNKLVREIAPKSHVVESRKRSMAEPEFELYRETEWADIIIDKI